MVCWAPPPHLYQPKEVAREVLRQAGHYHEVAGNLEVKEVWGDGRRCIVRHNPEEEKRDRKRREEVMAEAKSKLAQEGAKGFVVPEPG